MRWSFVALALVLTYASPAQAQDRWVFVPALVEGERVSSASLEAALDDRRVQTARAAATTVEARHSSSAPQLDEREMRRAQELVRHVTDEVRASNKGDRVGRTLLRELERLDAPVQDYLQRDPAGELLFQSCVLSGGLILRDDPKEAQELLRTCARTYPGRTPKAAPKVVAAYKAAAAEVADEPHGSLDVSGGDGCAVRLNGALVGKTPLHLDAVRVGTARLQVECGDAPGRVHGLPIEPGAPQRLVVDPDFEAALRTAPSLSLTYPDAAQRSRFMTRHAGALAKILDAHVVLLLPVGDNQVRALSLQPRSELGVWSTTQPSADALRRLRATLGPARPAPSPKPSISPDRSEEDEEPPPAAPRPPPPSSSSDGKNTAQVIAGGALLALGIGSLATAWVYYAQRVDVRSANDWTYDARAWFSTAGSASLGFAAGGGLLLSAATYLLLPDELSIPTSAWLWAGGGALLVAAGVGLMFSNSACAAPNPACRGLTTDVSFGALVALHAIPLLTLPLNYAIQNWLRPKRRIELGLLGTHATITYRF